MIREITSVILSTGEHTSIELIEKNHNVVCVIPNITITQSEMPPTAFQDIIDHVISLNRNYINKIYFDNVRLEYRFIKIQLFGHLRNALKKELNRPVLYSDLVSKKEDYKWITQNYLPKFTDDFIKDVNNLENKIKNLYAVFKKGKVNNIHYVLHNDYNILYNYYFEAHPIEIIPIFNTYLTTLTPITTGNTDDVEKMLINKFKSFYVTLIFKPTPTPTLNIISG